MLLALPLRGNACWMNHKNHLLTAHLGNKIIGYITKLSIMEISLALHLNEHNFYQIF
jgi:hypothetical protein